MNIAFFSIHAYRVLRELSFILNFYKTRLGCVMKPAFNEFYNVSGTSFKNNS